MEQFKIDVSKCTDDEKRQIQGRLFEMGYKWPYDGTNIVHLNAMHYVCHHTANINFGSDNNPIGGAYEHYPERPASDFLTRFQTRPHDYTECHPDIAAALKRGEEIFCRDSNGFEGWVFTQESDDGEYCYIEENGQYGGWMDTNAEPIPAEAVKKAVTLELTDEQLTKIKEMIDENA